MNLTMKLFLLIPALILLWEIHPADPPVAADLQWKYRTGGKIMGTAEIADGMVFFGSTDGTLHALQVDDGTPVWTRKTGGRIASRPAYAKGFLYFLSGEGMLYKVRAEDGQVEWTFRTEGPEQRLMRRTSAGQDFRDIWDYWLSSPAVYGNTVYFGSSDTHIYAVDTETGQQKWKFQTEDVVHVEPAVEEGTVYAGSFDGFIYALDTRYGSLKWKFDTIGAGGFARGGVQQGALIYDRILLFGSRDFNLYVLDKETGKGFWNYRAESWVIGRPTIHNGAVYFATSSSHDLYSSDLQTGLINWKITLPLRMLGSPVVHNDRVYAGSFDGVLYGVDAETGEVNWQFETDGHRTNYSTIFQEDGSFQPDFSIYGSTIEETAANDEKLMRLGSILATPVIHGNRILFGSTDSTFYSVGLPGSE